MMFQVKRGTRANLATEWRAKARHQRLVDGVSLVGGLAISWWFDWRTDLPFSFSIREYWPLMMPVVLVLAGRLVVGRDPKDPTDYRLLALAAGDRGAVEKYPPVIQAALMRLVQAGEHRRLMPLWHSAFWRMGVPFPPMAFSPWWLNALVLSVASFCLLPLWLFVQYWWNPAFLGEGMRSAATILAIILPVIMTLVELANRGTRERLGLPPWRVYLKDWKLRRR